MMRKLVLAFAALLSLSSACYAAFAIFQTASGPPQIFYNIVTDAGASCPSDVQKVTRNLTTVNGSPTVSVSVDTFVGGDVGKLIILPGAGFGGGTRVTTISTVSAFAAGKQDITVALAPQATLTEVSTAITYGTDDSDKFVTFNTWARANQGASNQVVLTIPSGRNCWFGKANSISGTTLLNAWAAGINNLIVEGAGATINSVDGFGFQLGGQGIIQIGLTQAGGQSARVQSVSAGATQVILTATSFAAGYISRFTAGRWIMLGGLDSQGLWLSAYGFPPNARYFEWRQITNVNTGTGTITLDRPLTNTYLATWPGWSEGSAVEADQGGPATIYAISDTWNTSVEYRGLTINQSGQVYAQSRNVTYRNITFGGSAVPTQNENWSAYNSTWPPGTFETDKLVGTMLMDGVTVPRIDFQSSSTDLFILRNSNVTTMFGTPTRAEITDTTFGTFRPGADKYGASLSTICTRCAVTTFSFDGGAPVNRPADYSMSGGVISFLNTAADTDRPAELPFVPPTGNVFWQGGGFATVGLFQVQAMTQDATNTFVQTNEAGTFPSITAGAVNFRPHPAPQFTCDACTGDVTLVATNIQRGATPFAPLGEFSSRDFAPTSAQGNLGSLNARGNLVSLSINVTQAYTGSGSATLRPTGQFHQFTINQATQATFDWVPSINLKVAGERIITPSGVTCDGVLGACSGDTCVEPNCFILPNAVWIQSSLGPYMGSALGAGTQPLFTMTLRTDQGVVP